MPGSGLDFSQMMRLMEAAKAVSAADEEERAFKTLEMFVTFQEMANQEKCRKCGAERRGGGNGAKPPHMFDAESMEARLRTPELLTIKTAIPYLEPKYQQNMRMLVKLIELQRLLELCREAAEAMREGTVCAEEWRAQMLSAIRPNFEPARQYMLDLFIRLLEIGGICRKMKEAAQ